MGNMYYRSRGRVRLLRIDHRRHRRGQHREGPLQAHGTLWQELLTRRQVHRHPAQRRLHRRYR